VTAVALLGLPVAAAVAQQNAGDPADMNGSMASFREKLILSDAAIKGLTESLAVANGETELFKRRYEEINTRVEALGVIPSGKETETLQTRLLAAVRDLRLLNKENDATREQLVRLSEAIFDLLKTSQSIDPKARLKVEQELRAAALLTGATHGAGSGNQLGLTQGTVVDVKPDLALVVANLGSRQGVKTGMPFQVWRGEKQIASVRVVDVRDAISAAIVQNSANSPETVHEGDTLRIDTTR